MNRKVFNWIKKEEVSGSVVIDNGWIITKDARIKATSVEAFQKHDKEYEDEYLIGVISFGKWYTVYRSESKEMRDKNFDEFEKFMIENA